MARATRRAAEREAFSQVQQGKATPTQTAIMSDNRMGVMALVGAGTAVYCCTRTAAVTLGAGERALRPRSMTAPVGAAPTLKLCGTGQGNADEMCAALPTDAVSFTLLRHKFGAASEKFVFIQFVGPSASIVKRGRHIARKDEIVAMLEAAGLQVHLELHPEDAAELTHAAIDAEVHKSSVDDGLQGFSSAGAKASQEAAIAKAKADAMDAFESMPQVLAKVSDVMNADNNWCALSADKEPRVIGTGVRASGFDHKCS